MLTPKENPESNPNKAFGEQPSTKRTTSHFIPWNDSRLIPSPVFGVRLTPVELGEVRLQRSLIFTRPSAFSVLAEKPEASAFWTTPLKTRRDRLLPNPKPELTGLPTR